MTLPQIVVFRVIQGIAGAALLPDDTVIALCNEQMAVAIFVLAARVRDESAEVVRDLEQRGLQLELLSGDAEAFGSAEGVLSAFPEADGIVGDLGGGSLELIDIAADWKMAGAGLTISASTLRAMRTEPPQPGNKPTRTWVSANRAALDCPSFIRRGHWGITSM